MNKRNLLKLAKFLETEPQNFNMKEFATKGRKDLAIEEVDCKSVCCAIGFAPILFPRLTAKHVKDTWRNDWFGLSYKLYAVQSAQWDWLFSTYWKQIDNTPTGAAMRIRYLVTHGVPDWFNWDDLSDKTSPFVKNYEEWKNAK